MWTDGERGPRRPRRARPGRARAAGRLRWPFLFAAGMVALTLALAGPPARAADPDATLTIVRPSSGQGPVGTNVVASIAGATASESFTIGYSPADGTCSGGFAAIATPQAVTADNTGSSTFYFAWPSTDKGHYYLCARDATNPALMLQSTSQFDVLATTPPSITSVAAAPSQATPSPGATPAPTATSGPGFTGGEQVVVKGTGFLPGGTGIVIYITGTSEPPTSHDTALSGQPTNTDTQGFFEITVQLPSDPIGTRYLHAVTPDGTDTTPPSLDASVSIQVGLAPTPSPSPSPTTNPVVSPTSGGSTNTSHGNPPSRDNGGLAHVVGVAGLGGLSLVLFVVGTVLLVTANGSQRPD